MDWRGGHIPQQQQTDITAHGNQTRHNIGTKAHDLDHSFTEMNVMIG
jgi:hypothetical protein